MAYTVNIVKREVEQLTDVDYSVTISVEIIPDGKTEPILSRDYTERYYSAINVDSIQANFQNKIKVDWDNLMAEKAIFDAQAFDDVVTALQIAATTYVNS
jgi:hypothetical protein